MADFRSELRSESYEVVLVGLGPMVGSPMAVSPPTPEELLRALPLLADDLPPSDLRRLAGVVEERNAARGEAFFLAGQRAEGLFLLRSGEAKVVKRGVGGREQILYLVRPGRPIVEGLRLDGGAYPVDALAMRKASALLVRNEVLDELGERHPVVIKAMLNLRAHRADRMVELVGDLALRTVQARLASFLRSLSEARRLRGEDPLSFARELTTETVASRLGTVREEISRGLAQLERHGALEVAAESIQILDLVRLGELADSPRKS